MNRVRLKGSAVAGVALMTLLSATACGSSDEASTGDGGIASTITVAQVQDQTGPVSYAGVGAKEGAELALEEINSQKFLGDGVTLEMEQFDTAGEIERASSQMTKASADKSISAILGPTQSQQAATVSPLVGRSKVPTVFTQAGAQGIVANEYTFRATPPMESYYESTMQFLADQGAKKISVLYNATFPTFQMMAENDVPEMADELGLEIVQSLSVQTTTQDFTGQSQQIAKENPDALVMLLIAPQSVTALGQLEDAGFENQIVATSVQAAGNISAAGASADGLVFPVPFSTAMEDESSVAFSTAFEEKFDKAANPYNADGYDAMWWIARAIKASGDSSREGIREGLEKIAAEGYAGAMGDVTFEGNDARVAGTLVRWNDGAETLVK